MRFCVRDLSFLVQVQKREPHWTSLECEAKGITITEWFDRQIATAKNVKTIKFQIVEKMEQVYDFGVEFPDLSQRKLRRVIRFVEVEL